MKNFLIEKLGGYTKDEMLKGIDYTIESVNELLDGKGVEWNIESRDLHFEGRAVAGEIGIVKCEHVTIESILEKMRSVYDKNVKSEPVEDKKPVAKKKVAKKVAKKTITKSN